MAVLDGGKSSWAEKRFFVKKNGYMGVYGFAPIFPFFFTKKCLFDPAGFLDVEDSQKGPQRHPGLLL